MSIGIYSELSHPGCLSNWLDIVHIAHRSVFCVGLLMIFIQICHRRSGSLPVAVTQFGLWRSPNYGSLASVAISEHSQTATAPTSAYSIAWASYLLWTTLALYKYLFLFLIYRYRRDLKKKLVKRVLQFSLINHSFFSYFFNIKMIFFHVLLLFGNVCSICFQFALLV